MRKRKAGRVGSKTKTIRKRNAVKDLSARKARRVVGGLLPAVRARQTLGRPDLPTDQITVYYGKIE